MIALIVVLAVTGIANAQRTDNSYLDSLKTRLQTVKQDTNRCRVLNLIVQSLFRKDDYTPALKYTNEELTLAEVLQDSFWIAEAHKNRAAISYRLGDIAGAEKDCSIALSISEKRGNVRIIIMITNLLSAIYSVQSRYDLSLKASFRALDLCEKQNAKYQASVVLTTLGSMYYHVAQREKAIEYYNRALALKREIDDFNDRDLLYINNALSYTTSNDFKNASKNLTLAYSSQPKHEDSFFYRALFAQALLDYKMHHLEEANKHFLKSYTLAKNNGSARYQAENLVFIALYNLEKNKLNEAERIIREGTELALRLGLNEINMDLMKAHATLDEKRGKFKTACGYLEKYNAGMDSTYNNTFVQNLMMVHAEHEQQESKNTLASQQKNLALKQQIINHQQPINILIGLSLVLLLILTVMFFQSYRRRQKISKLLEDKIIERNQDLIIEYEKLLDLYDEQKKEIQIAVLNITSALNSIENDGISALPETTHDEREYAKQLITMARSMKEATQRFATVLQTGTLK